MLNNYDLSQFFLPGKRLLFAGVGGVSMSALCLLCHEKGILVSGFDEVRSGVTDALAEKQIPLHYGFSEKMYENLDAVVYTAAIHFDDPILAYPASHGIPLISRADALGHLSLDKSCRIGISGAHGKSTTTGMLAKIFLEAQRDPMVLEGARVSEFGGTLRTGHGDDLIFEACEYQNSFLHFFPTISVILDVEHDHVDFFPTEESIVDSFVAYANLPGKEGLCILDLDTRLAKSVSKRVEIPLVTVSSTQEADFTARDVTMEHGLLSFVPVYQGKPLAPVKLSVPGAFQLTNALCAFAAAYLSGIPEEKIAAALQSFHGVDRRFQMRGVLNGIPVIDDYAHHPSEVEATLEAARDFGYKDIICVFQPHTFSRTQAFWERFTKVFAPCKRVIFADIYPAREKPVAGVDAKTLAAQTENGVYLGDLTAIRDALRLVTDADLFLIMGAGDIIELTDLLLEPEEA